MVGRKGHTTDDDNDDVDDAEDDVSSNFYSAFSDPQRHSSVFTRFMIQHAFRRRAVP